MQMPCALQHIMAYLSISVVLPIRARRTERQDLKGKEGMRFERAKDQFFSLQAREQTLDFFAG